MGIQRKFNKTKVNLFLDIGIVLAFVVELEQKFTGLRIHELLGLVFGVVLLVHIILHWNWIVGLTRRFFSKFFHESRFNYILDVLLFVDFLLIIVSGILISETLGFHFNLGMTPRKIHKISSNLSLVIIGLHMGLHWKWILTNTQKHLFSFLRRKSSSTHTTASPSTAIEES